MKAESSRGETTGRCPRRERSRKEIRTAKMGGLVTGGGGGFLQRNGLILKESGLKAGKRVGKKGME